MIKTLDQQLSELPRGSRVLIIGGGEQWMDQRVRHSKYIKLWDRGVPHLLKEVGYVVFTTFCNRSVFHRCRVQFPGRVFNQVVKPGTLSRSLLTWLDQVEKKEKVAEVMENMQLAQGLVKIARVTVRRGDLKAFIELNQDYILEMYANGTSIVEIGKSLMTDARDAGLTSTVSSVVQAVRVLCQKHKRSVGATLVVRSEEIKAEQAEQAEKIPAPVLEVKAVVTPPAPPTPATPPAPSVPKDIPEELTKALEVIIEHLDVVSEIKRLRKENEELRAKLADLRKVLA